MKCNPRYRIRPNWRSISLPLELDHRTRKPLSTIYRRPSGIYSCFTIFRQFNLHYQKSTYTYSLWGFPGLS